MTIEHVTVAGGGVLGSQIAYQTAYKGFDTTIYDLNEACLDKARRNVEGLRASYRHDLGLKDGEFDQGLSRLSYSSDLEGATASADLVIEAVPERIDVKEAFYRQLSEVAPAGTIFASNSSTLLPSQLRDYTDRPERYLHLHFANRIWTNNTAEVMGSDLTSPEVFDEVVDFARAIGMVPVPLHKEQPGYVLNSVLVPWLNAALELWAKDVVDPWTVDRTWMIDAKAPFGPFGVLDAIGLTTHYNIVCAMAEASGSDDLALVASRMRERIDAGLLGPQTGEGFYHWPDPECLRPGFLDPEGSACS